MKTRAKSEFKAMRYRFPKSKFTSKEEERLGICERHGAKYQALTAGAVRVLESVSGDSAMRIDLAIELLEQARYEIGCSRYTPPGRTPKPRRKDSKPVEAKKRGK